MTTYTGTGWSFTNYDSDIAILIQSGGTYTLSGVTFDMSGTYAIEISSDVSTDVTIALTNNTTGIVSSDILNSGTGSVTIENTKYHTLTGMASDTEVTYTDTDEAELYHVESVSSDGQAQYSYNYSGDVTAIILITHLLYENQDIEVTLGDADATLPIQQRLDPNYYNP